MLLGALGQLVSERRQERPLLRIFQEQEGKRLHFSGGAGDPADGKHIARQRSLLLPSLFLQFPCVVGTRLCRSRKAFAYPWRRRSETSIQHSRGCEYLLTPHILPATFS